MRDSSKHHGAANESEICFQILLSGCETVSCKNRKLIWTMLCVASHNMLNLDDQMPATTCWIWMTKWTRSCWRKRPMWCMRRWGSSNWSVQWRRARLGGVRADGQCDVEGKLVWNMLSDFIRMWDKNRKLMWTMLWQSLCVGKDIEKAERSGWQYGWWTMSCWRRRPMWCSAGVFNAWSWARQVSVRGDGQRDV